jgi:hypothetical protein
MAHAKADDEKPVRIRQRDTGGIREIAAEQWKKDGKALRAEGFVLVDENDQPLPEA